MNERKEVYIDEIDSPSKYGLQEKITLIVNAYGSDKILGITVSKTSECYKAIITFWDYGPQY